MLIFPNLTRVEISLNFSEALAEHITADQGFLPVDPQHFQIFRNCLSTSMPALRKLVISFQNNLGAYQYKVMGLVWSYLQNLEELDMSFRGASGPRQAEANDMFMGDDWQLPFLQLVGLQKLHLRLGYGAENCVSDAVFTEVFRKMRLTEFRIFSDHPIRTVTKAGIQSLLRGPFIETIENFPFRGWSQGSLDEVNFQLLGKRFPGNEGV